MRLTALIIGCVLNVVIVIMATPALALAAILTSYAEQLTNYGKGQTWKGL